MVSFYDNNNNNDNDNNNNNNNNNNDNNNNNNNNNNDNNNNLYLKRVTQSNGKDLPWGPLLESGNVQFFSSSINTSEYNLIDQM